MAQETNDRHEDLRELTPANVRIAVLHLIELAAAWEGWGLDAAEAPGKNASLYELAGRKPPETASTYDRDTLALRKLITAVLHDRDGREVYRRNTAYGLVMRLLTRVYASFRQLDEATSQNLRHRVHEICNGFGIAPTERDLLALTDETAILSKIPNAQREPDPLKRHQGAASAAVKAICTITGLGPRWVWDLKTNLNGLDLFRRPFGRIVSRKARNAYAAQLHAAAVSETEREPTLAWEDLDPMSAEAGLVLDRLAEWLITRGTESPDVMNAVRNDRRALFETNVEDEREVITAKVELALAARTLEDGVLPPAVEKLIRDRLEAVPEAREEERAFLERLAAAVEDAARAETEGTMTKEIDASLAAEFDPPPEWMRRIWTQETRELRMRS